MMKKRKTSNPKRQLRENPASPELRAELRKLATRVTYGGNPAHKRDPGDFNLSPPAQPRIGATLCDGAGVFARAEAGKLLKDGIRRGLVSVQERNGWPQNVWAVTGDGIPLEAQLDNQEIGSYHGYPMLSGEPLAEAVVEQWNRRAPSHGESRVS